MCYDSYTSLHISFYKIQHAIGEVERDGVRGVNGKEPGRYSFGEMKGHRDIQEPESVRLRKRKG